MPLIICEKCGNVVTEIHNCGTKTNGTFSVSDVIGAESILPQKPKMRGGDLLAQQTAERLVKTFIVLIAEEPNAAKQYESFCSFSADTVSWCAAIVDGNLDKAGATELVRMNAMLTLGLFLASTRSTQ